MHRLRLGFGFLLALYATAPGAAWADNTILLLEGSRPHVLNAEGPEAIIIDSLPHLTLSEAKAELAKESSGSTRPKSCSNQGCWVAFSIQSGDTLAQDLYISTSNDSAQIWVVRSDGKTLVLGPVGRLAERSDESGDAYPHFNLAQGESAILLVQFRQGSLFPFTYPLGIVVSPLAEYLEGRLKYLLFTGFLVGGLVALGVYNAFIARAARDASYYLYCLYLFFMAVSTLSLDNTADTLFLQKQPIAAVLIEHTSDCFMWLSMIGFSRAFLDTRRRLPRFDRLWALPIAAGLSGLFMGLFGSPLWIYPAYLGFAAPALLGVVAAVLRLSQGERPVRYFLVAQLVLATGALLQTFEDFGVIDFDFPSGSWSEMISNRAVWLASLVEATLFSLALADRFRRLTQTVSDQTIRHLHERDLLISTQKSQLELEVAERTRELEQEKLKSDKLLLNLLPAEIAHELKSMGHSPPRRHESVSILFTDFRNFTTTVSALPADRLVSELNEIFQGFDEILLSHGVEKIRILGDSYMVAAGLPEAVDDHARRCVASALEMLDFIARRNKVSAVKWGMRAGIHSGSVVAGIVGKTKFAFDVFGDTVNIASRMESNSEAGRLNVSAYTFDLVKDIYRGEYRGKVDVKGKGEIDMYFIDG